MEGIDALLSLAVFQSFDLLAPWTGGRFEAIVLYGYRVHPVRLVYIGRKTQPVLEHDRT